LNNPFCAYKQGKFIKLGLLLSVIAGLFVIYEENFYNNNKKQQMIDNDKIKW